MSKTIDQILVQEKLADIELESAVLVNPKVSIKDTIDQMRVKAVTAAFVIDNNKLAGILTQRDVLKTLALAKVDLSYSIDTIMTKNPSTLTVDSTLKDAIDSFISTQRRHFPVMDKKGAVLGLLSARALVFHVSAFFPKAILNLPPSKRALYLTAGA